MTKHFSFYGNIDIVLHTLNLFFKDMQNQMNSPKSIQMSIWKSMSLFRFTWQTEKAVLELRQVKLARV